MKRVSSKRMTVIAFYGLNPKAHGLRDVYESVLRWSDSVGDPPNRLGVHGLGFGGKMRDFSRTDSKLRKAGFESIESFDLESVSAAPESSSVAGTRGAADAAWEASVSLTFNYGYLACSTKVAKLDSSMRSIAESFIKHLRPSYGIGYYRERRLGPGYYAIGLAYGLDTAGPEYEEGLNIGRWGDIACMKQLYREGLLRDIYPWNFLTEPHVRRRIGGQPLRSWIRSHPNRGRLQELDHNAALWTVSKSERTSVRRALWKAGLIFNWRNHLDE
jgi:hypothetical protein